MAKKKGTGLLMVWADVPADKEEEFNHWYNEEHLAERLSVPGFLSGARYEAVKGGPKHLACYELDTVAVLESVQARPGAPYGMDPALLPRGHWHHLHP
jgi:hypothetical protein